MTFKIDGNKAKWAQVHKDLFFYFRPMFVYYETNEQI